MASSSNVPELERSEEALDLVDVGALRVGHHDEERDHMASPRVDFADHRLAEPALSGDAEHRVIAHVVELRVDELALAAFGHRGGLLLEEPLGRLIAPRGRD